jgi:hypothetical protein
MPSVPSDDEVPLKYQSEEAPDSEMTTEHVQYDDEKILDCVLRGRRAQARANAGCPVSAYRAVNARHSSIKLPNEFSSKMENESSRPCAEPQSRTAAGKPAHEKKAPKKTAVRKSQQATGRSENDVAPSAQVEVALPGSHGILARHSHPDNVDIAETARATAEEPARKSRKQEVGSLQEESHKRRRTITGHAKVPAAQNISAAGPSFKATCKEGLKLTEAIKRAASSRSVEMSTAPQVRVACALSEWMRVSILSCRLMLPCSAHRASSPFALQEYVKTIRAMIEHLESACAQLQPGMAGQTSTAVPSKGADDHGQAPSDKRGSSFGRNTSKEKHQQDEQQRAARAERLRQEEKSEKTASEQRKLPTNQAAADAGKRVLAPSSDRGQSSVVECSRRLHIGCWQSPRWSPAHSRRMRLPVQSERHTEECLAERIEEDESSKDRTANKLLETVSLPEKTEEGSGGSKLPSTCMDVMQDTGNEERDFVVELISNWLAPKWLLASKAGAIEVGLASKAVNLNLHLQACDHINASQVVMSACVCRIPCSGTGRTKAKWDPDIA